MIWPCFHEFHPKSCFLTCFLKCIYFAFKCWWFQTFCDPCYMAYSYFEEIETILWIWKIMFCRWEGSLLALHLILSQTCFCFNIKNMPRRGQFRKNSLFQRTHTDMHPRTPPQSITFACRYMVTANDSCSSLTRENKRELKDASVKMEPSADICLLQKIL